MNAHQSYDVIIIGGGTAGCAAATRLSEDPNRRVLLLEAGPDPRPIPELVRTAARQASLLLETPYLMMYPTVRRADNSTFFVLSGRIMGGGSSVNAMAAPRPMRYDLDSWAARGNPDWSYDKMLPVLKRIESDQDFPDSPIHGRDGPLYIKRPFLLHQPASAPVRAFIDRALEMGLPECPDLNVPEPLGVCASPYNIKDGIRQSAVVAYLEMARERPNLTILAEAQVHGLVFDGSGSRVEGVRFKQGGTDGMAAGGQVVLCSGAFHSPQLLMLSGVGPAKDLEKLGIPVVHDLPGVGENYQDHAVVHMTYEGPTRFSEDWVIPRFRLITKSDPSQPCGNFHIMMRPPAEVEGIKRMMSISAHLLEQRNRGRIALRSADPEDLPLVDAPMLEHPDDIQAMVNTMRFIHDLVSADSMKPYYGELLQPGPGVDWAHFARTTYNSYHHASGTCMMGPESDPMAVVDQRLKVHGLDNLYVADASIMPVVAHANTNLTTLMIAEHLSDIIKAL